MKFTNSGFISGDVLDFAPASGANNYGIFNGITRTDTPSISGAYGLYYSTRTPEERGNPDVDIVDFNFKGPYFYGYKNEDSVFFSGNASIPSGYIYELCHGVRKDATPLQNFYPAYYRYGYFEQPWGNVPTITAVNSEIRNVGTEENPNYKRMLIETSTADLETSVPHASLTSKEYHQLFGINPINCGPGKPVETCAASSPLQGFIYSYFDCPSDIERKTPGYLEASIKWTAGNGNYLIGAGLFNNSPIPNVFDLRGHLNKPDPCAVGSGTQERNIYNSLTCPAMVYETSIGMFRGSNGLLSDFVANATAGYGFLGLQGNGQGGFVDAPGAGAQKVGGTDQYWWFWNFAYKENADGLPFDPLVFKKTLAQEDWFWDHRLCPDYPKFLSHTFGGTVFANPETYFEVPYYSAIGKFGFYGLRFLNGKGSLISAENEYLTGCSIVTEDGGGDPLTNTAGGGGGPGLFDKMLKNADLQRRYSDFYAGNKGLFLALNGSVWANDSAFPKLSPIVKSGLVKCYNTYWQDCGYSGLSAYGYTNLAAAWAVDSPPLHNDNQFISISTVSGLYLRTGVPDDYLYTNNLYKEVFPTSNSFTKNDSDFLNKYSKYVVKNTALEFNDVFYSRIASGQMATLEKVAWGNQANGQPIDLFPLNKIYYSSENASGLNAVKSSSWVANSFNTKNIPQVARRYFQGNYSNGGGNIDFTSLRSLNVYGANDKPLGFNAGFVNDLRFGKMTPSKGFIHLSGVSIKNKVDNSSWIASGLSILGYNDVGTLDPSFSCFTPIFTQQPVDVICKIGQAPTFRALAVDYHTLPEDKMKGKRWPEINYWIDKLKLMSGQNKILYPVSYKWGRIPSNKKAEYNLGNLSGIQWANKTGDWCCIEKDGSSICTLIHPNQCHPNLTGQSYNVVPGMPMDFAEYIHGAQKGIDDGYLYFCLVSGRFGLRRSEPAKLIIDDVLSLDISFKNASPLVGKPKIVFKSLDKNNSSVNVTLPSKANVTPYYGFTPDKLAIPETAMADRRTANAAGCLPSWSPCCDENKTRAMGSVGYRSWVHTWMPPNIQDMNALSSNYGRLLGYGALVNFKKTLTQREGDALYGRTHLPKCGAGNQIGNYKGVPFDVYLDGSTKIKHWAVEEAAWATDYPKEGIPFNNGDIVSALYPPSEGAARWKSFPDETIDQSWGKGHWQFSNNLGLVKRLGYLDVPEDGQTWDGKDANGEVVLNFGRTIQNKPLLVKNIKSSLRNFCAGSCGWQKSSLGRQVAFFVEGFSSYYAFCGNKPKEFVTNYSFKAAGLRAGNAGFQYAWFGQPNSAFLSRETLSGPYAYFWKFNKHNRDRNGNGMPLGMYSYATDGPFSMMYDLPAVYGLYLKSAAKDPNEEMINVLKAIRTIYFAGSSNGAGIFKKNVEFNSSSNDDQTTHWCGVPAPGNSCNFTEPANESTSTAYCLYPNYARAVATNQSLYLYGCPAEGIKAGTCFPPCLSLRYDQGLIPGGKALDLFGNGGTTPDRIVGDATFNNHLNLNKEKILGPRYTAWAQNTTSLPNDSYKSINPTVGGGSDHCNYVTPTAWIGSTQKVFSNVNYMSTLIDNFA